MRKIQIIIGACFIAINAIAQYISPFPLPPLINGIGIYAGLKKCPRPCPTAVGDFYVSDINEYGGSPIVWYPTWYNNFTGAASTFDGLDNTRMVLKSPLRIYNIDIDNALPADINASIHAGIKSPVGAVELCFRKNYYYATSGGLIPGTTKHNMWYLPSNEELLLIKEYVVTTGNSFSNVFIADDYWSSQELPDGHARIISFAGASMGIGMKSNAYYVRCIRRDDPPGTGTIQTLVCPTLGSCEVCEGTNVTASFTVTYRGGNGGSYNGQVLNPDPTGVTGLTATLLPGNFVNDNNTNHTLTYTITGTPSRSGTASFTINIGGQTCILSIVVNPSLKIPSMKHCICSGSKGKICIAPQSEGLAPVGTKYSWSAPVVAGVTGLASGNNKTCAVDTMFVNNTTEKISIVYNITATTPQGCVGTFNDTIVVYPKPQFTLKSLKSPSCKSSDGEVVIKFTPASPAWVFTFPSAGTVSRTDSTISIKDLPVGKYTVSFQGEDWPIGYGTACLSEFTFVVPPENCDCWSLNGQVNQPTCDHLGSVAISGYEGAQLQLSGTTETSSTVYIHDLAPGTYNITITDTITGCSKDTAIIINCPTPCPPKYKVECISKTEVKVTVYFEPIPGCTTDTATLDWYMKTPDLVEHHLQKRGSYSFTYPSGIKPIDIQYKVGIKDPYLSLSVNIIDCSDFEEKKPAIRVIRNADCDKDPTADFQLYDLPETWTIKEEMSGKTYTGKGPSTCDLKSLSVGKYNYLIFDDKDQLITTLPLTVDCKVPIPGLTVTNTPDCEKEPYAKLQFFGLPKNWYIDLFDKSGSDPTYDDAFPKLGSFDFKVYDTKGGILLQTVPLRTITCPKPGAPRKRIATASPTMQMVRKPMCGKSTTADLEITNLPAKWYIEELDKNGNESSYLITDLPRAKYTYHVYDGKGGKLLALLTAEVGYPSNEILPEVSIESEDCVNSVGDILFRALPYNWRIKVGDYTEKSGNNGNFKFTKVPKGVYPVKVIDLDSGCESNTVSVEICK